MTYKQHALSRAFPAMASDELQSLADDIAAHGQREPGILFEGELIDGWHRQRACLMAGVDFIATEYMGADPAALVMSRNAFRRHLTASQRAMAAVACGLWLSRGYSDQSAVTADSSKSTKEMAVSAHVGTRTIEQAKVAHKAGLGDAVRDGMISAEQAAHVAAGTKPKSKAKQPKPPKEDPPESPFDEADLLTEMDKTICERDVEIAALTADDAGKEMLQQVRLRTHAEKELGEERNKNARLLKERDMLARWQSQVVQAVRAADPKAAMAEIVAWKKS